MKYTVADISNTKKGRENQIDHEIHAFGCKDADKGDRFIAWHDNSVEDIFWTIHPSSDWEPTDKELLEYFRGLACPCALAIYKGGDLRWTQ